MGSVIEYNDGKARKVLVLDVAYRFAAGTGPGNYLTDNQMNGDLSEASRFNVNGTQYINGGNANINIHAEGSPIISDTQLNSLWGNAYESYTSEQATDKALAMFPSTSYAWAKVRNVSVNGKACSVPNLRVMLRLICEGDAIDALDPTVNNNLNFALGSLNPISYSGYFCFKVSSFARDVKEFISANLNGGIIASSYLYYGNTIVPVIEL